jgi:hypothetical protein
MGFKSPEEELAEFLAALPSWHRKILEQDCSLSPEEYSDWLQSDWWQNGGKVVEDKYLQLLERCPEKWREYRNRRKKLALMGVPSARPGRRPTRINELASVLALKNRGLNQEQIAERLGLTKEAVRKRIKAAKKRLQP